MCTDVSEERSAFIFKVEKKSYSGLPFAYIGFPFNPEGGVNSFR
jgi:hypothetical protein